MSPFTLFVIDDDAGIRKGITLALGEEYRIRTFPCAEDALAALSENAPDTEEGPDLVLLDIDLPGMSGTDALPKFREAHPGLPVMMITGFGETQTAVRCMKEGAVDFILKPLHMTDLATSIDKALAGVRLRKEIRRMQARALEEQMPVFIAESRAIKGAMAFVGQIAKSPVTPVLISGETGTGKELVASSVHYLSPNYRGPFIRVNCAAIPGDLIESELFGYAPGAFSGARPTGKEGLVQAAEGGTLFLDEIGDLGLAAQAKILRFLEQGTFFRLGETREISVRTRVVSATNRDLAAMVEEGTFRRDLYFRIGVVKVKVPSLAQRKEDILPLAEYFLHQFNETFQREIRGLTADAADALLRHRWTGNVRELKNLMECAVLAGRGERITPSDLGLGRGSASPPAPEVPAPDALPPLTEAGMDLPRIQDAMERHYIRQAFELAAGNERKAARLLNMSYHNFRYRRRKWEI